MSRLKQAWGAACVKYAANPVYVISDVAIVSAIVYLLVR